MNKLTKVGLTALATSLVATASYAGELSVSGSASLTYTGLDTNSDTNPWAMGDSVKFNGGGDLDNGMTVSVYYELDGGTYDDYNLKLGMGDMGTLSFSGASSSGSGVDSVKDIVPNAYTPVYEACIPELTSSSAPPSNSTSCLPADTVRSSLIAIDTP